MSLEDTSLNSNVTPENKSVIVLFVRSTAIPSTVKFAFEAVTTWVALSVKEAMLPGLYFRTLFSAPLRWDFIRSARFSPSADFTIREKLSSETSIMFAVTPILASLIASLTSVSDVEPAVKFNVVALA